jgi:hypothetical protein
MTSDEAPEFPLSTACDPEKGNTMVEQYGPIPAVAYLFAFIVSLFTGLGPQDPILLGAMTTAAVLAASFVRGIEENFG